MIDKGKGFVYIIPLRIEISWWKRNYMGFFIYPAIALCRTGNTRGFKISIGRWTIDISKFNNK